MKNNTLKILLLFIIYFINTNAHSIEQFNFDITELKILENGEKIVGSKRGIITSNNGIIIEANQFEYYKKLNILNAIGDVKIKDTINDYFIYTKNIIYEKNNNLIFTKNGSTAIDNKSGVEIVAKNFTYNLLKNIITAESNATIKNKVKDYTISSNFIEYEKNKKKIYTKGKTSALINSKYSLSSSDVTFLIDNMELFSKNETTITDKSNLYKLENFNYLINDEILKGKKILINTNYNLPTSDKFYFASAIVNLKKQSFLGKDAQIKIKKDIFDNSENDPRLKGVSASSVGGKTTVNKGVFTSCKYNEKCTPWSIKAEEIIHDNNKKEIIYNNALLKIYDFPVLYFPKFFHPDPTVKRRSGFLKPQINNSNTLGNSFSIPYFSVLAENRDYTITPYIFDKNLQMFQNEFREINRYSKIYANFGFVNNYKSSLDSKKNSIFNLFANFDLDLNLNNFDTSKLYLSVEKVTNDTFLKIFETHIQDNTLMPSDYDNLQSEFKINLANSEFTFESGVKSYENLQKSNNDRYEYIFPYYSFNRIISENLFNGTTNFSSTGDNILSETNQLKSNINNHILYTSKEYTFNGLQSLLSSNIKNLNSVGKNNSEYKSSPQIELMSDINIQSNYPLIKKSQKSNNYLTPKILLKLNPNDMKNYSSSDRNINVNNIFSNNRLSLDDTLETGKSLTLGLDYKKENIDDLNKFFEIKLATVLRDKEEDFIPNKTTLNKKNSNIFGYANNNFSDFFNIEYKFALDNNLNTIEYSNLGSEISFNNFVTKFNFLEESGKMGSSNFLENTTSYNFDDQNILTFKTRRNKKLNLTEYYDLVYEYKNDCLVAGIKYKKTYYEDRDLKPSENLFFTISLIPLTNYEQKIDR